MNQMNQAERRLYLATDVTGRGGAGRSEHTCRSGGTAAVFCALFNTRHAAPGFS